MPFYFCSMVVSLFSRPVAGLHKLRLAQPAKSAA